MNAVDFIAHKGGRKHTEVAGPLGLSERTFFFYPFSQPLSSPVVLSHVAGRTDGWERGSSLPMRPQRGAGRTEDLGEILLVCCEMMLGRPIHVAC